MNFISYSSAKAYYDIWGGHQDSQSFYESPVFSCIMRYGDWANCKSVFEFGCGTGLFASQLFKKFPLAKFSYQATDISAEMLRISSERLAPWSNRVQLQESTGEPTLHCDTATVDRFVSTYVFDILSPKDIRLILLEAHRVLNSDGLLIVAGITSGHTWFSRLRMKFWHWRYQQNPLHVGGCRPMDIQVYLDAQQWSVIRRELFCRRGISSEVLFIKKSS